MGLCNKEGKGLVVPTVTIFNDDETVDYEGMKVYLDFLIDNGADALFALGTTQENATFSTDEYKELVKFIVEYVNGRVPCYIGVSSPATRISVEYAQYAESVGADAVFAGGPYYMRVTPDELMQFHRDIAASVNIPYLAYNNPGLAKLGLEVSQLKQLTEENVVKMIKDTTGNPVRSQDLKMNCKEGTKVFFGDDYGAFQAMIVGADGWTAGIGNVFPEKCRKIWDTVVEEKNYEEGFRLWKEVLPLLNVTINKDFYGKSGRADWLQMYKLGLNIRLGLNPKVRKPLFQLDEKDTKMVTEIIQKIGY